MSIKSKRVAYTEKELATILKNNMDKDNINEKEFYERYKGILDSQNDVKYMLSGEVRYDLGMMDVISDYLGKNFEEVVKVIEDEECNISCRGKVDENAEMLLKLINTLFDEMIRCRRYNYLVTESIEYKNINKVKSIRGKLNMQERIHLFRKVFGLDKKDYPIDLENILRGKRDYFILKFPNNIGISGALLKKFGKNTLYKCIYINTNESIGRQRFTLAHELYHLFFEESKNVLCYDEDLLDSDIEKRADEFASNIYIPRNLLVKFLKENIGKTCVREFEKEDIFELQRKFQVSFQAIVKSIDDTKKKYMNEKIQMYIPQVPSYFLAYYKSKWDEIEADILKYDDSIVWNSVNAIYEFSDEFKNDLQKSFLKGKVSKDEMLYIYEFFDEKLQS